MDDFVGARLAYRICGRADVAFGDSLGEGEVRGCAEGSGGERECDKRLHGASVQRIASFRGGAVKDSVMRVPNWVVQEPILILTMYTYWCPIVLFLL